MQPKLYTKHSIPFPALTFVFLDRLHVAKICVFAVLAMIVGLIPGCVKPNTIEYVLNNYMLTSKNKDWWDMSVHCCLCVLPL